MNEDPSIEKISILAKKWLQGCISETEILEFNNWYNSFDDEQLLLPTSYHPTRLTELSTTLLKKIITKGQER
jgi:hypothetical protein